MAEEFRGSAGSAARQRSVERLLQESIVASNSAENRALKRRVRQRLHKRLGAMLPPEEFEEATKRFRELELATASPPGHAEFPEEELSFSSGPWIVANSLVVPPWVQAVPVQGPYLEQTWCESSDYWWWESYEQYSPCEFQQIEHGRHEKLRSLKGDRSEPSVDAGDSARSTEADSQASEDLSLALENVKQLPVARTFLHFDTRTDVPHRRSKSV
ncbi:Uncharacterized protein SCF082_LOCUS49103 [Durusdinium trenchii]|uniref:Uncharacterized protein n=1 Tax=Durusdinium trenchii TaxID=1381693 RepID=A0ABP0RXH7_9DINO